MFGYEMDGKFHKVDFFRGALMSGLSLTLVILFIPLEFFLKKFEDRNMKRVEEMLSIFKVLNPFVVYFYTNNYKLPISITFKSL